MKRTLVQRLSVLSILASLLLMNGCAQLKSISDTLAQLQRLQFKLGNVSGFRLAGVDLSNLSSIGAMDAIKLGAAYASKKLPAEFLLNVDVKNPNDGSNGGRSTPATLSGLEFRLLVDGTPTINGNIAKEFAIPPGGSGTTVPVSIGLDLYEFFGKQGYDKIADLALAIGGKSGSASRLTLDAKPTVRTQYGDINYPGRINIIDKQYTN